MADALTIVQKFFPKVATVEDAKRGIWVEVTEQDSTSSDAKSHKSCVMAVACKRKQRADGVIISLATAYVVKGSVATRYKIPDSVSREIISFDRGASFSPGEYMLTAPTPSQKLGGSSHRGSNMRQRPKPKSIRRQHRTGGVRTILGSVA